jgi:hypothetical protein
MRRVDGLKPGRLVCLLSAATVRALHERWGDVTVLEAIELEKRFGNRVDFLSWKTSPN